MQHAALEGVAVQHAASGVAPVQPVAVQQAAVGNSGLSEAESDMDFAWQAVDGGKGLSMAELVKDAPPAATRALGRPRS